MTLHSVHETVTRREATRTSWPEANEDGSMKFAIRADRLEEFTKRIKALDKKAARFGVAAPRIEVGEPYTTSTSIEYDFGRSDRQSRYILAEVIDVTLHGVMPRVGGYAFIATLEPAETGTLIKKHPACTDELPAEFRHADMGRCDHCHTHRYRTQAFLVRDEADGLMQVGRSCLKDFVGSANADAVIKGFNLIGQYVDCRELGSWDGIMSGGAWRLPVNDVLAVAAAAIRTYGFVRSKAGDDDMGAVPTRDRVLNAFLPGGKRDRLIVTDADRDVAERARAWVHDEIAAKDHPNDFEHNLIVAVGGSMVACKNLGIAAYVPEGYLRHMGKVAEAKAQADAKAGSEWIGEPKQRFKNVEVTLTSARWVGTQYGDTGIYEFMTAEGSVLSWFTGTGIKAERGQKLTVNFTVADKNHHREWHGVKQTSVKRVTVTKTH